MPWAKGQSGNPKGRISDKLWRDAIMRAVKRRASGQDPRALDKLADKVVALGLDGDMQAIKEIGDRIDGKPVQPQAGADGESPQEMVVRWLTDRDEASKS